MRRLFGLFASVLLLTLIASGQELRQLTVSPALPAASGTMGVSHDTSGTTYINVQAKHLARPDQLHPRWCRWYRGKDRLRRMGSADR